MDPKQILTQLDDGTIVFPKGSEISHGKGLPPPIHVIVTLDDGSFWDMYWSPVQKRELHQPDDALEVDMTTMLDAIGLKLEDHA